MARSQTAKSGVFYQFKITLLRIEPPIWRRIHVKDGTLDQLHEHIQTAMGWTNSHLHHFLIDGARYGDPELLYDGFEEIDFEDSLSTRIGRLCGRREPGFRFIYEYDFGDGWEHDVEFEGRFPLDPATDYPVCVAGERVCPPEDCGGSSGYFRLLEVLANPGHKEYPHLREWAGEFAPERFSPGVATAAMQAGLPDWRSEPWEI